METLENKDTTTQQKDHVLDQILEFRDRSHSENVRKLKAGIKCIFTVPACFLILMFFTGTSKIIFLVLWIVSLFLIAAYLIHVEYSDYKIQEMVNSLQDSDEKINSLIDIEQIHSKVSAPKKKLDTIIADVRSGIQAEADTQDTEYDTDVDADIDTTADTDMDTTADTDMDTTADTDMDNSSVSSSYVDVSTDAEDINMKESVTEAAADIDLSASQPAEAQDCDPQADEHQDMTENDTLPENSVMSEEISRQEHAEAADVPPDTATPQHTTNTTEEVAKS